ncbi:AMP-binding protein [Aureibaculum sp. A20]|uniref:AMP-binding protein n=1 Tax=Aureibaculum flavum TaxID=2795986 RepID=A0ABS0WKV2_9FLAO|nr:AMP-binding protein [Aureibaculum flavum]MBJ2172601.1 AMP-binding protein [Aureibaculum flavum]
MFNKEVILPFLKSIETFENHNAFCINEHFYTYKELSNSVTKVRFALQKEKIINKNIGLVANDDIETYASIFAIWLEGCAYVTLHPKQPMDRIMEIIDQAEISLILNSSTDLLFPSIKTIESKNLKSGIIDNLPKLTDENSLAYILFTSGSTGKPKGVQISRKNIGAFMNSFWKTEIHINENDRCLQCFDLTFDVSVQSYLVPLTKGACIYTIPHDQIKYSYVFGLLEDYKLTFATMAPSIIRYLQPYFDEINAPNLRYNILTAEASSLDLVEEWATCIPNAEILDFYGPTEATIYCTYNKFNRFGVNKQLNGMMSIGKAMHGVKAIIIDEKGKTLGANKKGELCVSGDQLTPGYWKNHEKNSSSFFTVEIDGSNTRFYKTGDLCYIDNEGDILLSGRLDYQVKIQGYRIELGEIEFHARYFLKKINVVVLPFINKTKNTELALFIENEVQNTDLLIDYLKSKLPSYMIPTKTIGVSEFPINTNGKIDKNLLKLKIGK